MDKLDVIVECLDMGVDGDLINLNEFIKMCSEEELIEIGQTKTLEETKEKVLKILRKWNRKTKEAERYYDKNIKGK